MNWYDYVGFSEMQGELDEKKDKPTVSCFPETTDLTVIQRQHRAVCLFRPHLACSTCPHSEFVLAFNADKEARLQVVACPRWSQTHLLGSPPDAYVATEISTCRAMPFEFCSSCPSSQEVEELGADKRTPGWFGRWQRLKKVPDG